MRAGEAESVDSCPKCGRMPKLVQVGFHYGRSYGESSCYLFRYECRGWSRLIQHLPDIEPLWVAKSEGYHRWKNVAMGRWNAAAAGHSKPTLKGEEGA